jgi:hypothetical protein
MRKNLRDFGSYYRDFGREFGVQCYESWKSELRSTVFIAAIAFFLDYKVDASAKAAFVLTTKACLIWLWILAVFHLIRTPWRLARKSPAVPNISFKAEVIRLSRTILDFVYERIKNAPSVSMPDYVTEDGRLFLRDMRQHDREARALSTYGHETLEIYEYKYQRTVASVTVSLKYLGLDSSKLDEYMSGLMGESDPDHTGIIIPINERIKQIGRQLGILADQIKDG